MAILSRDLNERYARRHMRTGRKWRRLKKLADVCPACFSDRVGLNESHTSIWKRFWLECDECYYCGKSRPTIRMAIRTWNRRRETACCGNCIYGAETWETDINGWMICNSDGESVNDYMICDMWRGKREE